MSDDESTFEDPTDSLETPSDSLEDPNDSLEDPNENDPAEQNSPRIKTGGGDEIKIHDDRAPVAKTPEELVKVVQEKKPSECSIHNPNGQADVCSPPSLVQAMAKFVEAKGNLKPRPETDGSSEGLKERAVDGQTSRKKFRDAVNKVITSRKVVNTAKGLLS